MSASPRPVPRLPPALAGERVEFDSPAGRISCYVDGPADADTDTDANTDPDADAGLPPLLLVHSVNAAASAAEVRPLHDHARTTRRVYSLDLPGYGFSERTDRAYSPRLMTDAVLATAAQVQTRHGSQPMDVVGVSLGCEFVVRAAVEAPALFRRLALVSPTGFRGTKQRRGAAGKAIGPSWVHGVLRGPGKRPGMGAGWGASLFRGLTRPDVIGYFLRRTWGSPDIDMALWRYDVLSTRQPSAEFAPLCFLAAAMFSGDITTLYDQLRHPVWVSHGTRGDFTDYRGLAAFADRPNWRVTVFADTGALMYFEQPARFNAELDACLG